MMRNVKNRAAFIDVSGKMSNEHGDLTPEDHLTREVNMLSPYLATILYEGRTLNITCYLDREDRVLTALLGNVLGLMPLDIVDCTYGHFVGCQGSEAIITSYFGGLPSIEVKMSVNELVAWKKGEPSLRAYGIGAPTGEKASAPFTPDDVRVSNVCLVSEWGSDLMDMSDQTISLRVRVQRSGCVEVRHMIGFKGGREAYADRDNSTPEVLNELKDRVKFAHPSSGSGLSFYLGRENEPDPDEKPVIIDIGRHSRLEVTRPKIKQVTMVDDMAQIPSHYKQSTSDDEAKVTWDPELDLIYRLYYEGRTPLR